MAEIVMPRLSDSMEEGTVLTWLKQVGDEIAVGDEIVEIETDKANMAYESDVAGTLTEILAEEGATLPIGSPIARVGDSDGTSEAAARDEGQGPAGEDVASFSDPAPRPLQASSGTAEAPSATGAAAIPSSDNSDRIKASPVARRIAKEKGVDLSTIQGSGPGGRIVKSDVKKAATSVAGPANDGPGPSSVSPETAKGEVTYEDLSKLQSTIARRMSESKATAPHFYLEAEIEMSRAVEARARIKATAGEGEVVPSFNDMVVKACALALREHPRANGAYRDGRFELYSRVNVGVAVAAQDALVVPTVFDADKKGLRQIASDSRALAQRVREGTITPPELSGGTFTVSNLGMYGIDNFSAVINTPQAAILAVGAIKERPVVRDGELTTAQMLYVTLACDHRILYGAPAAEFLARIRTLLEEPLSLAL
ncbi:MAG TPA: dihydrolipoamide acetyltransferase family protein [Solirubrobacterales bacterium]|jgi:pyruvate dehydrogenase E2 component (dihydrolipoamide acetyltransferase)|nr:dihydrolipoamide acetyltransferase family protein [Solirubrobacterales bacterium]